MLTLLRFKKIILDDQILRKREDNLICSIFLGIPSHTDYSKVKLIQQHVVPFVKCLLQMEKQELMSASLNDDNVWNAVMFPFLALDLIRLSDKCKGHILMAST